MGLNPTVVTAMVPLTNMFGFVNSLRSMILGHASFTMRFDHHAPTSAPSIAEFDWKHGFRFGSCAASYANEALSASTPTATCAPSAPMLVKLKTSNRPVRERYPF
jgi:translation elongation factor EF-G